LLFGIIIGAIACWFVMVKAKEHPEAEQRYEESAAHARDSVDDAAHHMSDALKAKIDTLDLNADQVKSEMASTGKVIRHRAQELGSEVADAASDARIVTEIKAKYAADSDLSVWSISVSSDHGHVTLSGTVPNADGVSKAVALALEPKGVQDVTSTLEIKPKT